MHARHPQPHVPEGHAVFTQGLIELILKCNLAGAKTCERVYHKGPFKLMKEEEGSLQEGDMIQGDTADSQQTDNRGDDH